MAPGFDADSVVLIRRVLRLPVRMRAAPALKAVASDVHLRRGSNFGSLSMSTKGGGSGGGPNAAALLRRSGSVAMMSQKDIDEIAASTAAQLTSTSSSGRYVGHG